MGEYPKGEGVCQRIDTVQLILRRHPMTFKNPSVSTSEIIALAWADDVSFDKIKRDTGLSERDVIVVMRGNLKPRSFAVWRARVSGRKAKHERKNRVRDEGEGEGEGEG
jgi:uncharacterized protein (TIGR03643 family)